MYGIYVRNWWRCEKWFSGIDAEESSFVGTVSRLDDKSGDVFVPEVETGDELELIPERIVDRESERGNFVVDGAKLDVELENWMVFVLETGDKVEVISGIDAEESSFVVDVSRLDDKSGDVFVSEVETDDELELIPERIVDRESERSNFVVDGAKLDVELENWMVFVFVLETGDNVDMISGNDAGESSFVVNVSRLDDKSGDVFVPEVETGDELELIPERIVDRESERGNFVVDGAELDAELENIVIFVLDSGNGVGLLLLLSGIDVEESIIVVDGSRLDDFSWKGTGCPIEFNSENFAEDWTEGGNDVVDGTKLDASLENAVAAGV